MSIIRSILILIFVMTISCAWAQKKSKKKDKKEDSKVTLVEQNVAAEKKESSRKAIREYVKNFKSFPGLFTIYQDTANGSAYLEIEKRQIDKEFVYHNNAVDGPSSLRLNRGSFRGNSIISIRKYFNKIELVEENTGFYFDKNNAISKAAKANISNAVIASLTIVANDADAFLVKADDLFFSENLQQLKPVANPNAKPGSVFNLGSINKEKSKYAYIKNYPLNTDVAITYIFDNPAQSANAGKGITDDRFVSVTLQHSFIEVPVNNYKPRFDDPRVGFFTQQADDMTSNSATPYHDVINRWHLEKKNKYASVSEPVVPIVWWMENTTPVEYRETIKNAALSWNASFERAGFKNVIQVNQQPDDADWDAGDIRYNVLRWTSSPAPVFGGYGPSFVNPRTGQILGADIMLEYVFLYNKRIQEKLFSKIGSAESKEEDYLFPDGHEYCGLSEIMQQNMMFGMASLKAADADSTVTKDLMKSGIYYLILHEMGHTFGLNHNMKASQLYDDVDVHNRKLTAETGLMGSIMDYPAINVALNSEKQGEYFSSKPGPYDRWALEYGYSTALEDEEQEQLRLENILMQSTNPANAFGNDADDMRSSGSGIDPRVMVGDMSNNAITYSIDRFRLVEKIVPTLKTKFALNGQSYHELRGMFLALNNETATAARVLSRYVGGVYVDRSFVGQSNLKSSKPFTPVTYTDQNRALLGLYDHVFSPKASDASSDLYAYLQMQRRGFGFSGTTEDPKIHERILAIQKDVLQHLLHPTTLLRITDAALYGNKLSLSEYITELTNDMFQADISTTVNTFRQNLQTEFVNGLIKVNNLDSYDYHAKSLALYSLKKIKSMMSANPGLGTDTQAHRSRIVFIIDKALNKD